MLMRPQDGLTFLISLGKQLSPSFACLLCSLGWSFGNGLSGVTYESGRRYVTDSKEQTGGCHSGAVVLLQVGQVGQVGQDASTSGHFKCYMITALNQAECSYEA